MTPTNSKTPSLRERIASIISSKHDFPKGTVEEILLAVKEAMPEKVERSSNDQDDSYCVVWNACIQEMEKRCE